MQVEFVGTLYGGFPCIPELINKESIVLDFGVGEDVSFAEQLHKRSGCRVELFDFTPDSISWYKKNYSDINYMNYNEYGISDYDGILEVYDYGKGISRRPCWMGYENNENHPVKCLLTIMDEKKINHIDLLKLDVEGEEYKIIPDMFNQKVFPTQICLEEHKRFLKDSSLHENIFSSIVEKYILVGKSNDTYCFLLKDYKS